MAFFSLIAALTPLTVADASARVLASYAYTLNASGQRTQVVEKTGRNDPKGSGFVVCGWRI